MEMNSNSWLAVILFDILLLTINLVGFHRNAEYEIRARRSSSGGWSFLYDKRESRQPPSNIIWK